MSEKEQDLDNEELEQVVGGRNEVKRRRNIYNQALEERKLKTQGGAPVESLAP